MNETKVIRGQVRIAVKEMLADILKSELISIWTKDAKETQEATLKTRLDAIEALCTTVLEKQDKRARAIQGFLVQQANNEINSKLHNVHVTMLAWQEIMAEKIGDVNEMNKAIDDRKKIIAERLQKEYEERMAERIKADEAKKLSADAGKSEEPKLATEQSAV